MSGRSLEIDKKPFKFRRELLFDLLPVVPLGLRPGYKVMGLSLIDYNPTVEKD